MGSKLIISVRIIMSSPLYRHDLQLLIAIPFTNRLILENPVEDLPLVFEFATHLGLSYPKDYVDFNANKCI